MALLDDRRYPQRPIIGVGALILKRDRILMAQRGKQPLIGWWSLPGGALETGESLADAVRRAGQQFAARRGANPATRLLLRILRKIG